MNKICNIILLFAICLCSTVAQTTAENKPLVFNGPANTAFQSTGLFVVVGDMSTELFLLNPIASKNDIVSHISRYAFKEPSAEETKMWTAQFGKEKLTLKTRLFSSPVTQEHRDITRQRRANADKAKPKEK